MGCRCLSSSQGRGTFGQWGGGGVRLEGPAVEMAELERGCKGDSSFTCICSLAYLRASKSPMDGVLPAANFLEEGRGHC